MGVICDSAKDVKEYAKPRSETHEDRVYDSNCKSPMLDTLISSAGMVGIYRVRTE